MENLYEVFRQDPTLLNLHRHDIFYFDKMASRFPQNYRELILYINDCFNYHSPLLVDEKDWGVFLNERFIANNLPADLLSAVIEYESEDFVFAIASFLADQKETTWTTLVAKQNLRLNMLGVIQGFNATVTEKKHANELLSILDLEINEIHERLKQDQKRFGNYEGINLFKEAKNRHKINIAHFI